MSDSGRLSEKVAFKWRSEEAITLAKRMAGGRTFQAEGQPVQGGSQCRGTASAGGQPVQGGQPGRGTASAGGQPVQGDSQAGGQPGRGTASAGGQPVQGDSQCRGLRGECAGVLQGLRGGQGSRSTGSHTEWGMRSERHRKASRTHG